jgi:hypothetical protein
MCVSDASLSWVSVARVSGGVVIILPELRCVGTLPVQYREVRHLHLRRCKGTLRVIQFRHCGSYPIRGIVPPSSVPRLELLPFYYKIRWTGIRFVKFRSNNNTWKGRMPRSRPLILVKRVGQIRNCKTVGVRMVRVFALDEKDTQTHVIFFSGIEILSG